MTSPRNQIDALLAKLDESLQHERFRTTLYAGAIALSLTAYYSSKRIQAIIRSFLLLFTIMINSTLGILISLFAGLETNYHTTKYFADVCEWTIGLKITVENKEILENAKASVVVYNHQSMLDMIFLGRSMPRKSVVLAKKSTKWLPFLGQYFIFSKAVFIDRAKNKDAIASLQKAGQHLLLNDASLLIFPEGTRYLTEENTLRPFKKGAFHVAIEAGIPIIPIVLENQWKFYRPGVFDSATCKIRVLPPIPTKGLKTEDAGPLAESTRELMLKNLKEISTSS